MYDKGVSVVDDKSACEVDVTLYELLIVDAEEFVSSVFVFVGLE